MAKPNSHIHYTNSWFYYYINAISFTVSRPSVRDSKGGNVSDSLFEFVSVIYR